MDQLRQSQPSRSTEKVIGKFSLLATALLAALLNVSVAAEVNYQLDLAQVKQQQAEITMRLTNVEKGPVTIVMASASPGRYARHDFAKNIFDLRAFDAEAKPLQLTRTSAATWQVVADSKDIVVKYRLFADHADGTYSQIDRRHAHLNIPATFMFAPAFSAEPVNLSIVNKPQQWRVASQLAQVQGQWRAKNLDDFMDSPLEISEHQLLSFTQSSHGNNYQINIALHHQGTVAQGEHLKTLVQAFVKEQQAIFGELPDYAGKQYTFLADYLPAVASDGMEHRNSTVVTDDRSLLQAEYAQVETMSHEFFHAWNVERIRPKSLQPFDFTKTNMSDLLWYAEGFTNYYGKLALKRSGYFSQDAYFEQVLKALNRTLQAPGRRFHGPAGMSQQAVFVDAGVSVDPTDYGNNYLSYYTYGEVVALGLDLQLRVKFGRSLDQLMRQMWVLYGKTEIPYDATDLQKQLAAVSGDARFAEKFFNEQVNQSQLPDFKALFAELGLRLQLAEPNKAFAGGVNFRNEGAALLLASRPLVNSAWANAGVGIGDTLLQLGEYPISTEQDVQLALKNAKPGEKLTLKYQQKGEVIVTELVLSQDPKLTLVVDEQATAEQLKRRNDWLNSQAVSLAVM